MEISIIHASMTKDDESGYVGSIQFEVKGHKAPYELTLQSKRGRDWGSSLSFLRESGLDEEIDAVDVYLDEDDDAFYRLVQAAKDTLE